MFADGGECGRLMAGVDWSATPVGPVERWPASLRQAVRTVLVSRFPMVLTWGPGFTQFYNDAYAPCIGAKHPALGEDIRITLAEGWDALGPPIEHAMRTREASWLPRLPLPLERHGYREETYFTVSHAPAFGDDGEVAGMHAVLSEVTGEVIGERRQQLLHDLSLAGGQLGDERETAERLCAALATAPLDVPCAAVYLRAPDGDGTLHRAAVLGAPAGAFPAVAADAAGTVPPSVRALDVAGGLWGDLVSDAVALPLHTAGAQQLGVLVVGVNPNRAMDAEHRAFHSLLAGQLAGALADARAFDAERRRAEALAELDRAKTAFFANVSHELRTPLTLLLGPLADVLADESGLPADVQDSLELALRNGQRLQRLVNDLLDFVSIEAGRGGAVRVATDVAAFTRELAGVLRSAAERAGLRLSVDCPPLEHTACVDPRMWEKVVLNLLSNAVKYTFVGGIDVVLRSAGDRWTLTVADSGVGVAEDDLPHLFERFFRGTQSASRSREGTGIGLALVQDLVALHGGTVSVTSRPGAGSTFTVTMPWGQPDTGAAQVASPSPGAATAAAPWLESGPVDTGDGSGPTVLVVDDNADMRTYLTRLLSPAWQVRTAADGQQALDAVARYRPDMVLTDVMMPVMDGFELLRRLREEEATRLLPVIVLTARAGQEAAVEGLDAGADDYLAKPFRAPELLARMRVALERATGTLAPVPTVTVTAPMPVVALPPVADVATTAAADEAGPDDGSAPPVLAEWRFSSTPGAVPALRRRLRPLLEEAGVDEERRYDLLLAACEAATNAVEHAQDPSAPHVHVAVRGADGEVVIEVRDHGRWRERVPSMDRGRGSMLMSAFADVTATPGPDGTTVVISSRPAEG